MKFLLLLASLVGFSSATGIITPALQASIHSQQSTEAILELPQIIDEVTSSPTLQFLSGAAKVDALISAVKGATLAAQAPFLAVTHSLGLSTKTFWGSNIILIKGLTTESLSKLAATPGAFTLRPQFTASLINDDEMGGNGNRTQGAQWNILQIRAPEAWQVTMGEGCVAATISTGVNLGHVALSQGFAGAWMDPYYGTPTPTDQQRHGSHNMGVILGRANGIGVAPSARWIACRGLNHQGSGTEASLVRCGEFMLEASPRPNVVSNSWGGGSGDTWFNSMISLWRNAGIVPVFASGGSPGDQPGVISVGATCRNTKSRISRWRQSNSEAQQSPTITAPGCDITSSGTGANNYVTSGGTSTAAPHVAGAVCLVLSQNPGWTVDQVHARLVETAAQPVRLDAGAAVGV